MKTANLNFLYWVVRDLDAAADDEIASIKSNDDETGIRQVIRNLIKPRYCMLADEAQAKYKDAFRYYLTTGNAPFYDILDETYEWCIEPPTDPKEFFVWVWKELFPGEDYQIQDIGSWKETSDPLGRLPLRTA